MFCNKCGAELPEKSKFCSECGAKIALSEPKTNISVRLIENIQWSVPKILICVFSCVQLLSLMLLPLFKCSKRSGSYDEVTLFGEYYSDSLNNFKNSMLFLLIIFIALTVCLLLFMLNAKKKASFIVSATNLVFNLFMGLLAIINLSDRYIESITPKLGYNLSLIMSVAILFLIFKEFNITKQTFKNYFDRIKAFIYFKLTN